MPSINYSLMYVTDDSIHDDELFLDILESALKGGASIIQLREKGSHTLSFYRRAITAKQLCKTYSVPFIINDRVDIALAVDADGVHVGQQDMPCSIVRQLLGKDKIVGLSVSNLQQARDANTLDIDYIGISPLFATQTKTCHLAMPLGIVGLQHIKAITHHPIICIGGIDVDNTPQVIHNGADGIAVVSAISKAQHPELAAQQLNTQIKKSIL